MENKENNNSENISSIIETETKKSIIGEMDNADKIEEHEPLTTKIYYYVDDQQTPYSTEVPVPPSKITLSDFKSYITKRSYKYYCKVMDTALNSEVKAEIRDEYDCLKPCANGRFELFLLSENAPLEQQKHHHQRQVLAPTHFQSQKNCGVRASMMGGKRPASHYIMDNHKKFVDGGSSPEDENNQLFGDSNCVSSLSDGDSQYTTDFTSVSRQHHLTSRYALHNNQYNKGQSSKPYWTREKRKRYRRQRSPPSSFLSSTFDDTEVSMAVDLITVTFNMDTRRPFGMSVVVKRNRFFYGIIVHEVSPNSLVALDGRIKPGFILLEINGIALDEYETPEAAVNVLSSSVRQAVESRGQLKLTCARGDVPAPAHNIFHPPQSEPVRPIDPTAWVHHTNAARGLDAMMIAHPDASSPSAFIPKTTIYSNAISSAAFNNNNIITASIGKAAMFSINNRQQQFASEQKIINGDGLRLIQNPSTEITTSSGNSSLECSIGQLQQHQQIENIKQTLQTQQVQRQQTYKHFKEKNKMFGGKKVGGITSVIRRLMCIHSNASPSPKSSSDEKDNKNIKRKASDKGKDKGKK